MSVIVNVNNRTNRYKQKGCFVFIFIFFFWLFSINLYSSDYFEILLENPGRNNTENPIRLKLNKPDGEYFREQC